MDTTALHNPFIGINPLLHELLLTQNRWQEFHNVLLTHCLMALRQKLHNTPYTVSLEQSVRILSVPDAFTRYRPDLLITKSSDSSYLAPSSADSTATIAITDVMEMTEPEPEPLAILIQKNDDADPIAWVELLSPSNKPPFDGYYLYRTKREVVLSASIIFVELDFIHNQSPTLRYLDYAKSEQGAYPFHITTLIPNPRIETGVAQVAHFGLLQKIPSLTIPLLGDDNVVLDLDAVYQQLFIQATYASEVKRHPPQLTTYSAPDRERILAYLAQSK